MVAAPTESETVCSTSFKVWSSLRSLLENLRTSNLIGWGPQIRPGQHDRRRQSETTRSTFPRYTGPGRRTCGSPHHYRGPQDLPIRSVQRNRGSHRIGKLRRLQPVKIRIPELADLYWYLYFLICIYTARCWSTAVEIVFRLYRTLKPYTIKPWESREYEEEDSVITNSVWWCYWHACACVY